MELEATREALSCLEEAAADEEERVGQLRRALLELARARAAADDAITRLVKVSPPTTRTGHLRNLSELVGEAPNRRWQDEWPCLYRENLELTGHLEPHMDLAFIEQHETVDKWVEILETSDIAPLQAAGATRDSALTYTLLAARRFALARALRERSPRFAASTYALCDAIFSTVARQPHGRPVQDLYYNLVGKNSLAMSDPQWENLIEADSAGFRGLCCSSLVAADVGDKPHHFQPEGFCVFHRDENGVRFIAQDSPIVMFEAAPPDEHGMHAPLMVKEGMYGVYPPNTLYRLRRVLRGGFTAPNGVTVRQPLYVVSATYRQARAPVNGGGGGKLCGAINELSYGGRESFIEGLDGMLSLTPPLTMEQEFTRDMHWQDWKGAMYSTRAEWEYVNGPAERSEGRTAGTRDDQFDGMRPGDFLEAANRYVRGWCEDRGKAADDDHGGTDEGPGLLTLDEVLAVRLYSGPAYQPINTFLRQLAALSSRPHRTELARHPQLTFAATCRLIASAVRKLAAAAPAEEVGTQLYRGVRGELKKSFWNADSYGMIYACDFAFMSTSRQRETPIAYMDGTGPNVLWRLQCRAESDAAYHRGADISMLSQYAGEREVLFPPCTMLVLKNANHPEEGSKHEAAPGMAPGGPPKPSWRSIFGSKKSVERTAREQPAARGRSSRSHTGEVVQYTELVAEPWFI